LTLLKVDNLKTYYQVKRGYVKAVDGISFAVNKGEATGLAGESGCGKTTVALSVLRILPPGDQIVEAIKLHEPETSRKEAHERAEKLFELVGIPPFRIDNYPHEFSGGMRQRAMIAMALACNPSLLIADEPSTALDVIVAAQVLKLMKELKEKLDLGMMLITHDLSIIAETCEWTVIMYGGKIMEYGDTNTIFKNPLHPYTQGLIMSFPNIRGEKLEIASIPGSPPDLLDPPKGCVFHPRCKYSMEICRKKDPSYLEVDKGHFVSCHLVG